MKKLLDWFIDQDYTEGVEILKEHEPRNSKLQFFESVENSLPGSLHHNMLKSELERVKRIKGQTVELPKTAQKPQPVFAIADQPAVITENGPEPPESEPQEQFSLKMRIIKDNPYFKYEELTSEMQELYTEIGEDYKKMSAFHTKSKLEEISDEDRKHATNQAAVIEDGIQDKYAQLDAWIKQQREAPDEDANIDETAAKLKRLNTVRTYITRERKKLADLEEGTEEYRVQEEKLKACEEERDGLEAWKKTKGL